MKLVPIDLIFTQTMHYFVSQTFIPWITFIQYTIHGLFQPKNAPKIVLVRQVLQCHSFEKYALHIQFEEGAIYANILAAPKFVHSFNNFWQYFN